MAAQPQGEAFGRRARLGDAAACRPRGPVSQRPRRERKGPVGQMLYRPRKVGPMGRYAGLSARMHRGTRAWPNRRLTEGLHAHSNLATRSSWVCARGRHALASARAAIPACEAICE